MKARLKIDPDRRIGAVNPRIFGHLLARRPAVADRGLHYPGHPSADEHGIRQDVEPLIREVRPTVFRWPGGCTGTSYHWLDGVGPAAERPHKIDLHFGWEANHDFGTNEFLAWCRRMGAEPLLNFAMGTGTLEEAAAWVEYCNNTTDTMYANLRRAHGFESPWNVRLWQLGNEMYGPWEIGQTSAASYAETAREWAKTVHRLDPTLEIVAIGGGLKYTTLDWARAVIPVVAPYVDLISFHAFWNRYGPGDAWLRVLAGPNQAEQMLEGIAGEIRAAQWELPNARPMRVAVTEWNTSEHKLHMSESELNDFKPYYTLHDALANATFWNMLKRHCNEVGLATTAQIINVRGHIMVNERQVWREAIYWPLHMQVHHTGRVVLDHWLESDAFSLPDQSLSGVPYLDTTVTLDEGRRRLYCSVVNRHPTEPAAVDVVLTDAEARADAVVHLLYHDDPETMNGPDQPDAVAPRAAPLAIQGSRFTWDIPPHAYAVLEIPL